jgi:nucleoside-diphosphate-sugar epimerase
VIEALAGRRLQIERRPPHPGDVRDTAADTTRAQRDLGFRPAGSLAGGLKAEFEWLRAHLGKRAPIR